MCAVDTIGMEKPIAPPTVFMRRCWMNRCRRVPKLCGEQCAEEVEKLAQLKKCGR